MLYRGGSRMVCVAKLLQWAAAVALMGLPSPVQLGVGSVGSQKIPEASYVPTDAELSSRLSSIHSDTSSITSSITSKKTWTGRIAVEPARSSFIDDRIEKIKEQDTPKLTWKVVDGWTLPENNVYRNYVCRLGALQTPCWDEIGLYDTPEFSEWPSPIFCPTGYCCGDKDGRARCLQQCSGGGWAPMAGSQCTCSTHQKMCPENTVCDDNDRGPYGGVYCKCKEGYVGDGYTCHPDPCADETKNKCAPGKCVGRPNGDAYCDCPLGYMWDSTDPTTPKCVFADTCEDEPCGSSEVVLECRTDKPLEYTCVCRSGFEVGTVDGQKRCIASDIRTRCEDEPCGTEGLLSCTDTPNGAECLCKKQYRLVTSLRKKACIYSPCDEQPCGDSTAVKSCIAGISTYSCTCNSNYKLDTVDGLPVCVSTTENYTLFLIATGLVGLGLLVSVISCIILRRKMLSRSAIEAFEEQGMQNMMGTQQDGINADASSWM